VTWASIGSIHVRWVSELLTRAEPNSIRNHKEKKMKTLNMRWRLIALLPLVAIVILSIGNRIEAVPDQNQEVREAANEGGIWVVAGITHGQILRFNVARLANHPGGMNLELRVFDSHGNVLVSHVFPNQNQNGGGVWISFFDLSADQLPASAFDNTGRAQLTGVVKSVDPTNPHRPPDPSCGFVASGEIFNFGIAQTLVHIAGTPISRCR
jgi:hypothetical protein